MKRIFLCLMLLVLALPAYAETQTFTGRVREDMPELSVTVTQTGEFDNTARHPYTLTARITAEDGSLMQEITWQSNETPDVERAAALVMFVDYNFDGYADLQLLTAAGARNVFYAVALWDADQGCFRDVTQDSPRLPGGESTNQLVQAAFCNPAFYPDALNPGFGYIYSVESDGFRYRTEHVYGWETRYGLETCWVASVYDAGDGLIGESLEQWGTGLIRWWDQTYPEDWYYGDGNASAKRTAARRLLMLDRGSVYPCWMQVANVDWVNLRQLDSKASPPLAKLDRGTEVQVLATGCGEDGGWVLVLLHADSSSDDDHELDGMTGYIWHSYLEELED